MRSDPSVASDVEGCHWALAPLLLAGLVAPSKTETAQAEELLSSLKAELLSVSCTPNSSIETRKGSSEASSLSMGPPAESCN